LGPLGLRIWKVATAELARVLMRAKEASRELNIFYVLKMKDGKATRKGAVGSKKSTTRDGGYKMSLVKPRRQV